MSVDRTERLLALLLLEQKKGSQQDKAVALSVAGFTNTEIADLLQTTTAVIAQNLYTARKGGSTKTRRK